MLNKFAKVCELAYTLQVHTLVTRYETLGYQQVLGLCVTI